VSDLGLQPVVLTPGCETALEIAARRFRDARQDEWQLPAGYTFPEGCEGHACLFNSGCRLNCLRGQYQAVSSRFCS